MKRYLLAHSGKNEFQKISRVAELYNMIPNLLWTALFLVPITIFCCAELAPKTIGMVLGICFIPIFFPNSFFDKIQLGKRPHFYKRIGVRYINNFVQNGSLLNNFLRRKFSGFKVVSRTTASIKRQYNKTYFFEKFHFALFLFFTVMTVYAAIHGRFYWVLVFIISNLFYNIYPNLLQQYIRLKLKASMTHKTLL